MKRKELFSALIGSWNYNLNTEGDSIKGIPASDKDKKIFLCPSFDDLYYKKEFKQDIITDTEDRLYEDIRKFERHITNMNWLEVLYSKEVEYNPDLTKKEIELLDQLFAMRDELAVYNLSYLYNSTIGMFLERSRKIYHYSASCKYMEHLFGYNTKEVLHAYRLLYTLMKFADQDFKDFEKALRCNAAERSAFLAIKFGMLSKEDAVDLLLKAKNKCDDKYANIFHSKIKNTEIEEKFKNIIYELIKINISKEELNGTM